MYSVLSLAPLSCWVSILVLVDFVRNAEIAEEMGLPVNSFNPCFSGFCSECVGMLVKQRVVFRVSILVLVDFVRNVSGFKALNLT